MSENLQVQIQWIATHRVPATTEDRRLEKFFTVEPHETLFSDHGISDALWVVPTRIRPKAGSGFHALVSRGVSALGDQTRLPFRDVRLGHGYTGQITNFSSELFPGSVAVTRVSAKVEVPGAAGIGSALASLGTLRSAKQISAVDHLIAAIAGCIEGRPRRPRTDLKYSSYFAMQMRFPQSADELETSIEPIKDALVALLIGTENAEMLRNDIVEKVWSASEELNAKAVAELMLLNRQGFLHVLPGGTYQGPHMNRFPRTCDLAVLGAYARELLRGGHDFGRTGGAGAEEVLRRLSQWIRHPRTTFDTSVSQTFTWMALVEQLLLEERLAAWTDYFESIDLHANDQ